MHIIYTDIRIKFLSSILLIWFHFKGYDINLEPCRTCKAQIKTKIRQCPYCGTLNPTVKLKEIFIGIAGVILVMSIVTYFMNN